MNMWVYSLAAAVSVKATLTAVDILLSPYPGPGRSAKGLVAERWAAPRLSLFDSLKEAPQPERAPPKKKGYLLKWDLDITRFHTEDLVCHPWHHNPLRGACTCL